MESPTLTPQMMGELANHLRNEGMAAYQRNDMREAMIWFAQCLSVLRQIGHNEELICMLLYHIGMIYGLAGKNTQSIAFFEASARIQENQDIEEATADTLHLIAQSIDAIEYPTRAQPVLEKALAMYEALNLQTKANQLRTEIKHLDKKPDRRPLGAKTSDSRSYRFAICLDTQELASFTVTPNGVVHWSPTQSMHWGDSQSGVKSIPMGRSYPWYVVATGSMPDRAEDIQAPSHKTLYKLALLQDGGSAEHLYGNTYDLERTSTYQRLCVGVQSDHGRLVLEMAQLLSPPYYVLYVLHTSRRDNELARYQSPALSYDQLLAFFTTFQDFLASDGRHDLWIHGVGDRATVVWDRHNLIYVYGPLDKIKGLLIGRGFTKAAPHIPVPHSHNYHSEYDESEDRIIRYLAWTKIPLRPEDEQ